MGRYSERGISLFFTHMEKESFLNYSEVKISKNIEIKNIEMI